MVSWQQKQRKYDLTKVRNNLLKAESVGTVDMSDHYLSEVTGSSNQ
jgi:hypothetical protein